MLNIFEQRSHLSDLVGKRLFLMPSAPRAGIFDEKLNNKIDEFDWTNKTIATGY